MKLYYVQIRNFRSIENATVVFEPRCLALIGINESGKSNILKALALLDDEKRVEPDDIRDFGPDESSEQDAFIRFVFLLDKEAFKAAINAIKPRIISPSSTAPILSDGKSDLTVERFVQSQDQIIYRVDLDDSSKHLVFWKLSDDYRVLDGWYQPKSNLPADVKISDAKGNVVLLKNLLAVHGEYVKEALEYVEDLSLDKLLGPIRSSLIEYAFTNKPDCLYWTYSDSQLLPGKVNTEAFAVKPSSCEPLRQMFTLAGFDDVKAAVAAAKARPNGMRNLLNRVASRASKHIKEVWKEHKGISIELSENGEHIDACVKDRHNLFDFSRRSDGFKRFVSFLLLVSAKVKNRELSNTLYLHDEPDIGLHPSGAKYLRDELIEIATNNYVVYSTHSIFMVDRERIGRHLIVTKKDEVSTIAVADAGNIADEEVLFNALGYSIFESLKPFNIIFEGWRDKQLFRVAIHGPSARSKKLKKDFADVGFCHAKGVKDIGRVTPMMELAARKWIIVSDSDKPAREAKRLYDGDGKWLMYDELLHMGDTSFTGEDFVKIDAFRGVLTGLQKQYPALAPLDFDAMTTAPSRIHALKTWLHAGGFEAELLKKTLDDIKEKVFTALKPSQIEDRYYDICDAIADVIKS